MTTGSPVYFDSSTSKFLYGSDVQIPQVDVAADSGTLSENTAWSDVPAKGVTGLNTQANALQQRTNWIRANQPVVVTNVSALRALDKTKIGYAVTKGYYTAGDGGAGEYWYDSSDTTSTDNGCTIIVASDSGRWKLRVEGFIRIKQSGVKADGSSDDSPYVQNATNTGIPILWTDGTYKVSGIAYTGKVVWVGQGYGTKILSDSTVITVTSGTGSYIDNIYAENITAPYIISRDPASWATIPTVTQSNSNGYQPTINDSDVWSSLSSAQQTQDIGPHFIFQGDATKISISRVYGRFVSILMYDASDSVVRDCSFRAGKNFAAGILFWNINSQIGNNNRAINNKVTYASYSGICAARNYDFVAEGNEIYYAGESGIKTYQDTLSGVDARCYRARIQDNKTYACYYDGFDLCADYPVTGTIDTQHRISNNHTYANRMAGFVADGKNNTFSSNSAYGCQRTGLYLTYNNCTIDGNFCENNNSGNYSSGVHEITVNGDGNNITCNRIVHSASNGYAIYAEGTNFVVGNKATGASIFIGGAAATSTAVSNIDSSGSTLNTAPSTAKQDSSNPAMTLFSASSSIDSVDLKFHPRKQTLANPIGGIKGTLTYGVSGAENGAVGIYAAQAGTLCPSFIASADNLLPGKAYCVLYTPNAVVPPSWLPDGSISVYLDESGNNLKFSVRYSGGTTKTGTVALS